jgi:hypothetical protein
MTQSPPPPVPPWEPPIAGSEAEHLFGSLERLRTTFRWKVDDLDATGLGTRTAASVLTLGALLKHLALVEDHITTRRLDGSQVPSLWSDYDPSVEDWDFVSAADDSPEELYTRYDEAVKRARARFAAAVANGGLDQEVALEFPGVGHLSLRRLVCDLLEEYGRHTGHADLIREAVDGRVGEDPPPGWRPVCGTWEW